MPPDGRALVAGRQGSRHKQSGIQGVCVYARAKLLPLLASVFLLLPHGNTPLPHSPLGFRPVFSAAHLVALYTPSRSLCMPAKRRPASPMLIVKLKEERCQFTFALIGFDVNWQIHIHWSVMQEQAAGDGDGGGRPGRVRPAFLLPPNVHLQLNSSFVCLIHSVHVARINKQNKSPSEDALSNACSSSHAHSPDIGPLARRSACYPTLFPLGTYPLLTSPSCRPAFRLIGASPTTILDLILRRQHRGAGGRAGARQRGAGGAVSAGARGNAGSAPGCGPLRPFAAPTGGPSGSSEGARQVWHGLGYFFACQQLSCCSHMPTAVP